MFLERTELKTLEWLMLDPDFFANLQTNLVLNLEIRDALFNFWKTGF